MKAYWLGLLYALLSASVSYITANGLVPPTQKVEHEKSEQTYRDWYNRDRMSGTVMLNHTAGKPQVETGGGPDGTRGEIRA